MLRPLILLFSLLLSSCGCSSLAFACLAEPYKSALSFCADIDDDDLLHKLLRVVVNENHPRQIAVVGFVSNYTFGALPESKIDAEKLVDIFKNVLRYDEVIVLGDDQFNRTNLLYIFGDYLKNLAHDNKGTRIVFTFSGHGVEVNDIGYLFLHGAKNLSDPSLNDSSTTLNFEELKGLLLPTMSEVSQFLALINSCESGDFLESSFLGEGRSTSIRSVLGITSGLAHESVETNSKFGSGTLFFELIEDAIQR
jgi:hypothetical protein